MIKGTVVQAVKYLYLQGVFEFENDVKKKVAAAFGNVSKALYNTPAICRSYYIYPAIIESYHDGSLFSIFKNPVEIGSSITRSLSRTEKSVLNIPPKK